MGNQVKATKISSAPETLVVDCGSEEDAKATSSIFEQKNNDANKIPTSEPAQLSDLIGHYGPYQAFLTLLLFARYLLLGLMSNAGPLLAPDVNFYCVLPLHEMLSLMPNITNLPINERDREIKEELKQICQLDLQQYNRTAAATKTSTASYATPMIATSFNQQQQLINQSVANHTSRYRECTKFSYDPLAPDQARTLTTQFDLVCDREVLRSVFQSALSGSIVIGHVFWGTFSDKFGRFTAQRWCLAISLVAGILSILANDFWTITIARVLCCFGDLGLVVSLTTNMVELVGSKYRGVSVSVVNFASALGVALLPYIVSYYEDFRLVLLFSLLCHLMTAPFILLTNESVRWLMTNGRYEQAQAELGRILRWNSRHSRLLNYILGVRRGPKGVGNSNHSNDDLTTSATFRQKFDHFKQQILESQYMEWLGADQSSSSSSSSNRLQKQGQKIVQEAETSQPKPTVKINQNTNDYDVGLGVENGVSENLGTRALTIEDPHKMFNCNHNSDYKISVSDDGKLHKSHADRSKRIDDAILEAPAFVTTEPRSTSPMPTGQVQKFGTHFSETCEFADLILLNRRPRNSSPSQSTSSTTVRQLSGLTPCPHNGASNGEAGGIGLPGCGQRQAECINLVAHQLSFIGRVNRLFRDTRLMIAVLTIVWTTFNSELLYTSFIIINLEVGENKYLNYLLGACMEGLAAIVSSSLLWYAPRRQSLITFWLLISATCFGLSIAHVDSHWSVWLLALAKFLQSSLSSIAMVAAYESFPTSLRQSGSGLVFTLGMLGSVFAPLIFTELDDQDHLDLVLMTFSVLSLSAGLLIHWCLKETKDRELQ